MSIAAATFPEIKMDRYQPPSRTTLWLRFFGGIAWFGFLAWLVSISTRTPFRAAFVVVSGGGILTACLALAWLTLWAQRRNSVAGQFTIGSVLFATCFAAIFCAAVRWIGVQLDRGPRLPSGGGWLFLPVAFAVSIAAVISIPIVFGMLNSMLRFGIWSLRRPALRRGFRSLRRR
ncbi:MAG TPA: hypothetical protein VGN42_21445 [Pirellulales bacterium]|nr:hypothetical protein [Pirellulales bacterium]